MPWPPKNAARFVRSERFGRLVLTEVEALQSRQPSMDFSDAVAHVFEWFDRVVRLDRDFLKERFPSEQALKAYIRKAAWNAARIAARQRQRHSNVIALDEARLLDVIEKTDREALEEWLDAAIAALSPAQRVVVEGVLKGKSLTQLAKEHGVSVPAVHQRLARALDKLADQWE